MADNTTLSTNVGTGDTIRTLEDGSSIKWAAGVTAYATTVGTPDVLQIVTPTAGLPIQIQTGSSIPVTDNSGSLTVDAPVGTPVFVRLSDGSAAISALPVTDNGGSLTVDGTVAATQSGTWSVNAQGAQAESATLTANPVPIGGWGGNTPQVQITDGKAVYAWFTRSGALNIADAGGSLTVDNGGTFAVQAEQSGTWSVTDGGGSLTVDGTVAATQSGTWNVTNVSGTVSLPTGAATAAKQPALGTAGTASSDVITVQGIASMTALKVDGSAVTQPVSGTFWQATQPVSLSSVPSHDVTNGGTFAVQAAQSGTWNVGTVTTVSTVTTCSTLTGSGVAHDAADSGNPHKIGAKATTALSGLTLVADADRTDLRAGVDGALITRPHANLEDIVTGNATNTDGTSTQCIAAQAAGIKTYLTTIILANSHATTNCTVDIKDGTTVKLSIPVPANGGAVVNLPVPLPGTAATAWNFDPSAAVTTISCSMIGFRSKV